MIHSNHHSTRVLKLSIGLFFYSFSILLSAQPNLVDWYSESKTDVLIIQNSYPKGGPYPEEVAENYSHSYLVFFTRISNVSDKNLKVNIEFEAKPFTIPNSQDTYMQIFLPEDEMHMEKLHEFSYGFSEIKDFNKRSQLKKEIAPSEDIIFYTVAFFYQTKPDISDLYRGGNRAEFILEGEKLYYNLLPQIEALHCGSIEMVE